MKPISPEQIREALENLPAPSGEDADTLRCHHCQDTKMVCWTEHPPKHPAPVLYSRPCEACQAGRDLAEAWDRREQRKHDFSHGDRADFVRRFQILCAQFGKSATRELVEAYWQELRQYTPDELTRGFKHVSRTCRYFPKIAEILEGVYGV